MNLSIETISNSFIWKHRDIFLFFLCVFLIYFQLTHRPTTQTVVTDNPLQAQELKKVKDENGKLYAQITQTVLDKAIAEKLNDSLAKALKLKPKYIKGVDRVIAKDSIVYRDRTTKIVEGEDTAYKIEFHDPWTDIVAVAGKDTGSIKQVQRDTITRVETEEGGNGLFSKPIQHHVFLGNANPHVDINQGASFTVQEKKVWLTLGPYIGYDFIQNKPSVGVSVQIPIFQFKK